MGACPTWSSSTAAAAAGWNGSATPSWTGPRPPPTGSRALPPAEWKRATLRWGKGGWVRGGTLEPWPVRVAGLTLECRPAAGGQLGVFPEHAPTWAWLDRVVRAAADDLGRAPEVLSLFGYTGGRIARLRQGRRPGRARGLLPARRRVGSTQRRAVGPGRGTRPLARRGRPGVRPPRAPARQPLRRRRPRPADATGTGTAPGRSRSTSGPCSTTSRRSSAPGRRSSS